MEVIPGDVGAAHRLEVIGTCKNVAVAHRNGSELARCDVSDGAARGNPGPAAFGALLIDPEGKVRRELSEALGVATNNVAEYRGLIAGLEAAIEEGARRVEVKLDSELLVRQATGVYRVKNPGLQSLYQRAQELARQFDDVRYTHVPRAQNKDADALANQALDAAR
jgi:ribonuclease H / adenosylcobalamin/alpha-ribazole phosphatase